MTSPLESFRAQMDEARNKANDEMRKKLALPGLAEAESALVALGFDVYIHKGSVEGRLRDSPRPIRAIWRPALAREWFVSFVDRGQEFVGAGDTLAEAARSVARALEEKAEEDRRGNAEGISFFARVFGAATEDSATIPTPEDVDAELAPKGLPVIDLVGPAWVGPWRFNRFGHWMRDLIKRHSPQNGDPYIVSCQVAVYQDSFGGWHFTDGDATHPTTPGYPTPEAAQEASEAAIFAAWRNR